MPGNRKVHRNGFVSNSLAADKVEEVMRRFKTESKDDSNRNINNNNNGGALDESGSYPERPGEPDCIYYLRTGTCGYGTKCRFNHPSNAGGGQVNGVTNITELPQRLGQPDCGYYLRTGTCKYGSSCENHHPKDRNAHNPKDSKSESSVSLNILGLPMRQDGKPCPYYMRTGSCKYGYTCKFHHPQPTSAASVVPAYGSGGSAGLASTGAPSVGEYSATSSLLHFPQNCVPVMSQSWNAYAGNFSPVASVLSAPCLPERPDQPECRYYMNHGSCKYGSDCKYHHPRDKTMQLASGSIGPLGLPLRPGQPVCLYYGLYGLCKYGPTCKYDHPLDGYLYAYSMSSVPPTIPTCYSSSSPYQSISSLVPSSEMSSPSRSSKSGDCVKKGVTIRENNRHLDGNCTNENSPDVVSDVVPHSSSIGSSDVTHNESD